MAPGAIAVGVGCGLAYVAFVRRGRPPTAFLAGALALGIAGSALMAWALSAAALRAGWPGALGAAAGLAAAARSRG